MEENHQPAAAAHTTPNADQQEETAVVVSAPVAVAESMNNDPADEVDGSPAALLGGPRRTGLHLFTMNLKKVFKLDELGSEVLGIAVPASLALTADPLASLIDTAFVGRLGSVEIAAVGVAIAVFNQVMKVCIYPLVSVTTSFVAEEDAILSKGDAKVDVVVVVGEEGKEGEAEPADGTDLEKGSSSSADDEQTVKNGEPAVSDESSSLDGKDDECAAAVGRRKSGNKKGKFVPSVTSALIVGAILGLFQTALLVAAGKPLLKLMGVKSGSPMMIPALRYLTLRSLGAPAVLLSLAMQGVFRGFKDTRTPLYATVAGDLANIVLDPILIFGCRMGVVGAAIAHVLSQYLITLIMLSKLVRKVDVVPPSLKCLKFRRFLGCGEHINFFVGVAAVSIPSLILLSAHDGFVGIWIALTIYMSVRAMASTWRMGAARGPWRFLRQ
ncbi:hypothetical protein PR202_gb03954 [Eleusine coracana subsp. coracana]|uniref:Protein DETOXIFICATION n=1 Tax=Eleusine coracana subsp. coracana TaxID=191504 RepID=A0AAV5E323_ELECO|nr:hypothetical protein PR202_gb03954 [Eleusine coracana subsp. coracana]